MAENHIHSEISAKEVTYLEGTPTKFTVTATNRSDEFASFQLKLEVLGSGITSNDWYEISPIVSSKNPPGDSTKFDVEITNIPIKSGETVGEKIRCQAIVSSIELLPEEDRIPFNIKIEKTASIPLQVSRIHKDFYQKRKPGEPWEIGIEIYNPRSKPAKVLVKLSGLKPNWLEKSPTKPPLEGSANEQSLDVPVGKQEQVIFYCQPDKNVECKTYPFTIQVIDRNSNAILNSLKGKLEILLKGELIPSPIENESDIDKLDKYKTLRDFLHNLEKKTLETLYGILLWRKHNDETYKFQLENKSNLPRVVSIKNDPEELEKFKEVVTVESSEAIHLPPGEQVQKFLTIKAEKAPLFWLFGEKMLELKFKADWSDRQEKNKGTIKFDPIKFPVKSIFPIWGLLLLLSVLSGLLWWFSCLNPISHSCGHQKPVKTLQFNGLGERLVSGSQDTKIIEWDTVGFFNPIKHQQIQELPKRKGIIEGIFERDNKNKQDLSVFVIRYRPVNNNIVAAGLENGQIQLWDLTRKAENPIACFWHGKIDRVLALEFSQDSRYLFSSHGNGRVIQWKVDYNQNNWSSNQDRDTECDQQAVVAQKKFEFAVYALKFVGEDDRKLAIAGRYNQLLVLDSLEDKTPQQFRYPSGGQSNYIESLDAAEFRSDLLVSADNQGRITLWDLKKCSPIEECQPVEQWDNGHNEKPVRSVALSADGCYLVSGGDDGRVMLWSLTSEGKLAEQKGKQTKSILKQILDITEKQTVNSVDLKIDKQWRFFSWNEGGFFKTEEKILIASGWENNPQVQVEYRWKKGLKYQDCNKP